MTYLQSFMIKCVLISMCLFIYIYIYMCLLPFPTQQQTGGAGRGSGSPRPPWRCRTSRGHPPCTFVPARSRRTARIRGGRGPGRPTFPPRGEIVLFSERATYWNVNVFTFRNIIPWFRLRKEQYWGYLKRHTHKYVTFVDKVYCWHNPLLSFQMGIF